MDPTRFDHLTRLLGRATGRRAMLAALVSAPWGGATLGETIASKNAKGKDRGNDRDRGQDRGGARGQQLQAERRGQGKRRKKKRGGRKGNNGGQPSPPSAGCCGTRSCAAPERGSTRSECDFSGRSFAGQDHNGSIFRGIDGRNAVFTATDNRGSVFAEACLQGARFRRARLDGSTWEDACLFGADFTGAVLDADDPLFAEGLFCDTAMPDGSVNDRDCGRESACCQRAAEPAPSCQTAGDCPDAVCQKKACQNGVCAYAAVVDADSPNALCAGHCCEGDCCTPGATACNPQGLCCVPNCAGKQCGPDGCGGGTCGTCPTGEDCNDNGRCIGNCRPQNCPNGCCDDGGNCQTGNTGQACGTGGRACATCGGQASCQNGECSACVPACQPGQRCNANGRCVCDDESCPNGCCDGNNLCQPGNSGTVCGADGRTCLNCEQLGDVCVGGECVCTAQSCPDGCCDEGPGEPGRCFPNRAPFCGVGGAECVDCSGANTCNAQGQCVCAPICAGKQCGPDGCGNTCGNCRPGETCTASGQCRCTANSCPSGQQCCGGRCGLPNGNVCCQSGDCCSGNCFNYRCVDQVATCGGVTCDEPANGCAGGTCCGDPATITCDATCCGPPAVVCNDDDGGCSSGCGSPGSPCCQGGQCCDGVCCDGVCCGPQGECRNGQCVCVPKTCAELGRSCGTAPDGCGGTLECGVCAVGPTPSCKDGVCVSCPEACPGCPFCVDLANGDTQCGSDDFSALCTLPSCSTNASCTDPEFPVCLASLTDSSNQTTTALNLCPGVGATAVCSSSGDC